MNDDFLKDYKVIDDKETIEKRNVHNFPDGSMEVRLDGEVFIASTTDMNIDEDNLTEEACMLGQRMAYYGDIFARARANLAAKEEERKAVYSKKYVDIRRDIRDPSSALYKKINEKMTEAYIDNFIVCDPEYRVAVQAEYVAKVLAFRAETWWRAIQKKADLINMLGYKQSAELKKGY